MSSSTTTRSAKLYSELTPAQLANIAQGYMAKLDRAELQRIIDALPVYTYRAPCRDYFRALEVAHDIAMLAALSYWRMTTKLAAAHGLCLIADSDDPAKLEERIERLYRCEGAVDAIIAAWQEICERMGWDIEALSETAQIPIKPAPADCDQDYKAELLQAWEGILEAAGMMPA
jgi:hypothetical protein